MFRFSKKYFSDLGQKIKSNVSNTIDNFIDDNSFLLFNTPLLYIIICFLIITIFILLSTFVAFPVWITMSISIILWVSLGNICFRYETFQASGPRGTFINPAGHPEPFDGLLCIIGGLPLHILHVLIRKHWVYLNDYNTVTLLNYKEQSHIKHKVLNVYNCKMSK